MKFSRVFARGEKLQNRQTRHIWINVHITGQVSDLGKNLLTGAATVSFEDFCSSS